MNRYLELSTYPEVPDVLRRLKDAGMRLAFCPMARLECWRPRLQMPATPICSTRSICVAREGPRRY